MKPLLTIILTFHLLLAQTISMDIIKKAKKKFFVDIDNDRKKEAIIVVFDGFKNGNKFYRIVIIDDNNKILWKSPPVNKFNTPFAIGEFGCGLSMPEIVADINQNNKMDIVISLPQCTSSPQYYKIFEIDSKRKKISVKYLKALMKVKKRYFRWKEPKFNLHETWVMSFKKAINKNLAIAEIFSERKGDLYHGTALIKFTKRGAKLLKYITPMRSFE